MDNGQNSYASAHGRGLPRGRGRGRGSGLPRGRGRGRIRRAPEQLSTPDPTDAAQNRRRRRQRMDSNNITVNSATTIGVNQATQNTTVHAEVGGSLSASSSARQNTSVPRTGQHIIGETSMPNVSDSTQTYRHRRTCFAPLNLGGPQHNCPHCGAFFWYQERIRRDRNTSNPKYNLCCKGGRIFLPHYDPPPEPLLELLTMQDNSLLKHFFDNIRRYNTMFAFTSMGAKVNESINDGHGPYVFKISGQPCHRVGSLIPARGQHPEYAQLYIHDTANEIAHRKNIFSSSNETFCPNEGLLESLIQMFNAHNPIVKLFRTASERIRLFGGDSSDRFSIRLFGTPDAHGDIYSAPVASEVVGLVVGDIGITDVGRDLIIEDHESNLQQISEDHCKFMAMQYPLLFPYGEPGYHDELFYRATPQSESMLRKKATILEYYAYRLHDRPGDFNTPLRGKRLTQAYEMDAYCCVEGKRIRHYRKASFQNKYRPAPYKSLATCVSRGITTGSSAGQRIILPSSFTGGPRYLYQNYQDCIAICRKHGCPDLFITFTENSAWPEIMAALSPFPGQHPPDRPDIIDRVFKMKLNLLMDDIEKHEFFGPINAVVYTIEFQKRGLPHAHIILWLQKDGALDAEKIDRYISAQLPNPVVDPIGYAAVSSFMIHGPCGPLNSSSVCMLEGKCSKSYPKDFCEHTTIMENGFTQYARLNNGITVHKNHVKIDNTFFVPHNVDLVVKYQAHINVEKVNNDGMHKYLFKYVTKGFDCARIGLLSNPSAPGSSNQIINEINNYLECRYITPHEACWRLLQFDIHHTDPSVERLPVHLPFENNVVYTEDDDLEEVIENPNNAKTKLTAWLMANAEIPHARQYTYLEFPEYFTWQGKDKYWSNRQGYYKRIGRIAHVNPAQGELYYLRMLLHIVKGPKSSLKSVLYQDMSIHHIELHVKP